MLEQDDNFAGYSVWIPTKLKFVAISIHPAVVLLRSFIPRRLPICITVCLLIAGVAGCSMVCSVYGLLETNRWRDL